MSSGGAIHDLTMASVLSVVLFASAYLTFFMRHLDHETGSPVLMLAFVCGYAFMVFWLVFRKTPGLPLSERIADALADALLGGFVFLVSLIVLLISTLGV